MKLTPEKRAEFDKAYAAAPCTREAIEAVFAKFYPEVQASSQPYPVEWYADKDNRLKDEPTGHLRYEGKRMVWVAHA